MKKEVEWAGDELVISTADAGLCAGHMLLR
jgi:hypothetical protein